MGVFYRKEHDLGFIEFDLPDSKVNLLTGEVIRGFEKILDEIRSAADVRAVVILSRKKDVFIAGADIKEIESITQSKEGEQKSRAGQKILDKLEDLSMPTIAVIDGVALGGGCELILACRYRVATFNEKVRIGLPEVNLGIIPGFGGTYRMPRVVGLLQGIKLVTSGRPVSGKEALRVGLVDRLVPQAGLMDRVREFVSDILAKPADRLPRLKPAGISGFLENTAVGRSALFSESRKSILKATKGFYPAPMKALEVIQKTFGMKRDRALAIEAEAFSHLAVTDISKNLVKVFYLTEKYKKFIAPGTEQIKPAVIHKCGVVGAGVMGGGIAQLLSYNDIQVRLKDINYDAIAKGLSTAAKLFKETVRKRRLTVAQARVKMGLITGTLDHSGFKNTDVVIEAVVEDMNIKKKVFKQLSEIVSPETILCTNTSALSVTEMAEETRDPSKVIGLHFFNPVHRMPLIEIIKTDLTSPQTVAAVIGLSKRLGKTPVLVKDSCGFLVNRILLAYINEAGRLMEETGEMELIDNVVTHFGMPMGPFTLSDEVGLDVGIKVLHILEKAFGERFKPVQTFESVFKKGLLGKKTGKGFYVYGRRKIESNPEIASLIVSAGRKKSLDEREALDRMLYIMINEAGRCLDEKVIEEPDAVDVGMILGTGFPPFRGGLLRYADSIGISNVVIRLEEFAGKFGDDRFQPCRYLVNLKEQRKGFYA